MNKIIEQLADTFDSYIIERRRYYHAHPELSFAEWETTKSIAADCESMGLSVNCYDNHPGLVATLDTAKPGKTILLRAAIDAMPVYERTGLSFASQKSGIMHSSGNDSHIAMLLGTAKILAEIKDELSGGKILFLFESGKEKYYGAKYYIDHDVLTNVDAVFTMQTCDTLDASYISVDKGRRAASLDVFNVSVLGQQSSDSTPECGNDALLAACSAISSLQSYISRKSTPVTPLLLTIGHIQSGNSSTVISGRSDISGSVRTFSNEFRKNMRKELNKMLQSSVSVYDCSADVCLTSMTPPVINDNDALNTIAENAVKQLYGKESIRNVPPMMSSDDFGLFTEKVPGFFGLIGVRNNDTGINAPVYTRKYTVDETVLHRGAAVSAQFAIDFLTE